MNSDSDRAAAPQYLRRTGDVLLTEGQDLG